MVSRPILKQRGFNSQPPEGGWGFNDSQIVDTLLFQLTAARRRLETSRVVAMILDNVSTHSRPKAAGGFNVGCLANIPVSTHSRPKAAGWALVLILGFIGWFQLTAARRRLAGQGV